jgi:hypothetical protein
MPAPWVVIRRHLSLVVLCSLSARGISLAQIQLSAQHGATPNEVILTWSGGTPPYNLYMGGSGDLSGAGVKTLLANTLNTTHTLSVTGDIVYFSVGDSSAPVPTITDPSNGANVTFTHLPVMGTTTTPAAAVWVNRQSAQLSGTSFSALGVLLALGNNTLHAAAIAADGNISITSSQVTRIDGNTPPTLSIVSPLDAAQVWDVTPLIQVTYSDTPELDPSRFRAYLDGSAVTSKFTTTPTGATWQISSTDVLAPGTHVLRVTIQDANGFTQSASSQFRVSGPRLDSLAPSKALPGATVTISGDGFGTLADTHVDFNGGPAAILNITPTQILVQVPASALDGSVFVYVSGVPSNGLVFDLAFDTSGSPSYDVAIDVFGRVYYLDRDLHVVYRLNQDGGGMTPFFSTSFDISAIAFDPAGTSLYVSTRGTPTYQGTQYLYSTGRIYSVALDGTSTLRFTLSPFSTPRYSDPGGLDIKPPFVYVGAVRPDLADVVLRLDLNNPSTQTDLITFPLSNWIVTDVKLDSLGNIYTIYSGTGATYDSAIYRGASLFYQAGSPRAMTIDCIDRVMFTDPDSGQVLRLLGAQSAEILATITGGPHGIDLDSRGNLFVGLPSDVRRVTAAGAIIAACDEFFSVSLSGDSAVVYADFDPSSSLETPNVQYVILTACLGNPSVPRGPNDRVCWLSEDVDDPATDPVLDPSGGADNLGGRDGAPEFTQEGSFTLTVGGPCPFPFQYATAYGMIGSNVCSKVRFRYTDAPGDNFWVHVALRTMFGNRLVTSNTMTVWKRAHVELDSMGEVQGIIEPDDAVIGDVPNPTAVLLSSIFAPAYIAIIADGPGPTTDVAFDHHVPTFFTSLNDPAMGLQIEYQGALGREATNVSSSGSWRLYAQGDYEGPSNEDYDPNTEGPATLGISNELGGKYSLAFAETLRDYALAAELNEAYLRMVAVSHELAHQFGVVEAMTADGSGGIMEGDSNYAFPYFNASQLRAIRSRAQNNGYPSGSE